MTRCAAALINALLSNGSELVLVLIDVYWELSGERVFLRANTPENTFVRLDY